jgi:hypothetical protein
LLSRCCHAKPRMQRALSRGGRGTCTTAAAPGATSSPVSSCTSRHAPPLAKGHHRQWPGTGRTPRRVAWGRFLSRIDDRAEQGAVRVGSLVDLVLIA